MVLLKTFTALAQDAEGRLVPVNVLLDGGSQGSFITDNLARKLNLEGDTKNFSLGVFGGTKQDVSLQSVSVKLWADCKEKRGKVQKFVTEIDAAVKGKLTGSMEACGSELSTSEGNHICSKLPPQAI